jgi:hypothetical protein
VYDESNGCSNGCVASSVFERFRHPATALEGPSIGHFRKNIKHSGLFNIPQMQYVHALGLREANRESSITAAHFS